MKHIIKIILVIVITNLLKFTAFSQASGSIKNLEESFRDTLDMGMCMDGDSLHTTF